MPTTRHILLLAAALVPLAGCETLSPAEDPTQIRLANLERRIDALERVLANGSLVELTLQVDELQRAVAQLQGRTEQLEHQGEGNADRQRTLYADLDDRIQALESGLQRAVSASNGSPPPISEGELPIPGGTDSENYQAAFELLKEQRYEEAGIAFEQFLVTYPDSSMADNAQYWLAEAHYVTDDFERALGQFNRVIDRYPRCRKVPDALLKIGYANYELERWDAARTALMQVQSDYPDTTAARLAEQRLKRMVDEGH